MTEVPTRVPKTIAEPEVGGGETADEKSAGNAIGSISLEPMTADGTAIGTATGGDALEGADGGTVEVPANGMVTGSVALDPTVDGTVAAHGSAIEADGVERT